jgi:hypothetical protein
MVVPGRIGWPVRESELGIMSTDVTVVNPDEIQWTIVHEESPDRILFEEEGDWIVGTFAGHEWITPPPTDKEPEPEPFLQLLFRNVLTSSGESLRLAVTNAGYSLRVAFEKGVFTVDGLTRITLVKLTKIEGQQSPMKDIRVESASANADSHK